MYDAAVIGAGISGMATAARLQARGLRTIVFEAHGRVGGCAGYFRKRGFAFDVGATTLVDFQPDGVGGELIESIGMKALDGEALPGYIAWLPDRTITLHRDPALWHAERLAKLGATPAHQKLWRRLDQLADAFWTAARHGVKLPLQTPADMVRAAQALGFENLPLARYLTWTMGDLLRDYGFDHDDALRGLLGMLVEDTVHSTIDHAPLINAALGITIRGAGLTRHRGGMAGFWQRFTAHYRALGGEIRLACPVKRVDGQHGAFTLHTARGTFEARQVISTLPPALTATIGPRPIRDALAPYLRRDAEALGGAVVVFLGVPESEVEGQSFTHHQLLQNYQTPLGDGNNMFVSVSAPDDRESAPAGYRAVMISTHTEVEPWEAVPESAYALHKRAYGDGLIHYARRVYPDLAMNPLVYEIGTPRTYKRFTHRPHGAVGGVKQSLANTNQHAVPYDVGVPGFWLAGDGTWPGLGTVACVLGSRIVAEKIDLTPCPPLRRQRGGNGHDFMTSQQAPLVCVPNSLPEEVDHA